MKQIAALLFALTTVLSASAQTELTSAEARSLYKSTSKQRASVHDPSVVWEPNAKRYYIFGTHHGCATSTDLQNWSNANWTWRAGSNAQAFVTPKITKVKKGGQEIDFPAFNAMEWSARTDDGYSIDGNMWAPDVIWNPTMQKWMMYMSINGDSWHSSIVLLTADHITGPYDYQGPVVISGFQDSGHSYKGTDLEVVIGTQSSLPSRYAVGSGWGKRWPHTIDPCPFYDQEGKLWLAYGSWSGGIWMLELDEETGLRDFDVTYPSTNGSSDGVTSDPYFGKKIAGGFYVSGEGPYIRYIGGYYYLFVSYGFLDSVGGYEMRVFRSKNPNGPYLDGSSRNAIFTQYVMNYGSSSADKRGEKIMGPYSDWGYMTTGERSQGHNSLITDAEGRTLLVYHTRFDNGTEGHQVRVHQLFQNEDGWLVASPFEFNGETITSDDMATGEDVATEAIAGTYQMLIHKYPNDYKNREQVEPIEVVLSDDGHISGSQSGTWTRTDGTGYITLKLGSTEYKGVVYEEEMDSRSIHAVSITAVSKAGQCVWAQKMHPKYALAWQLNNQKVPVVNNQNVSMDIDLQSLSVGVEGVTLQWTSSMPDVISEYGKYDPRGLAETTPVTLEARLDVPGWYWAQSFSVNAAAESYPEADWKTGIVAHYGFDNASSLFNSMDTTQEAQLLSSGTAEAPVLDDRQPLRTESVVHLGFGGAGNESYVQMPNPLRGQTLSEGATISFWLKPTTDNQWDALFGFVDGNARLYMTGNSYVGYNSGTGNWLDVNHPSAVTPGFIEAGKWQLVTLVINSNSLTLYVNGTRKSFTKYSGSLNGADISTASGFDYSLLLAHLSASDKFYLGNGSFWGSPDAMFDDVMVYNRPLSFGEVLALRTMENRVYNFREMLPTGIADVQMGQRTADDTLYDLQGRRVTTARKGLYISNGRKVYVR